MGWRLRDRARQGGRGPRALSPSAIVGRRWQEAVPSFFRPGTDFDGPTVSASHFQSLLRVWVSVHEACLAVSHIGSASPKLLAAAGDSLREDVVVALRVLTENLTGLRAMFAEPVFKELEGDNRPWRVSSDMAREWMASAQDVLVPALHTCILDKFTAAAFQHAQSVASHTPGWNHCLGAKVYHVNLIKRQIVQHVGRAELASGCVALKRTLGSMQAYSQEIGIDLQSNPEWVERTSFSEGVYREGRTALAIIAGCTVAGGPAGSGRRWAVGIGRARGEPVRESTGRGKCDA